VAVVWWVATISNFLFAIKSGFWTLAGNRVIFSDARIIYNVGKFYDKCREVLKIGTHSAQRRNISVPLVPLVSRPANSEIFMAHRFYNNDSRENISEINY
jgi:hypothetical protein